MCIQVESRLLGEEAEAIYTQHCRQMLKGSVLVLLFLISRPLKIM